MDARVYLQSYGWKEGEALKNGGIRKPILVKHKKDTKGLGHDSNDADLWWERLFDGQLKNLDVTKKDGEGVQFKQNQDAVADSIRRASSPLYRMFVRGQGLAGTVGRTDATKVKSMKIDVNEVFETVIVGLKKEKEKEKRDKKEKKSKDKAEKKKSKDKTEKKEKKSKHKSEKKEKKPMDKIAKKEQKSKDKIKKDKKEKKSKEKTGKEDKKDKKYKVRKDKLSKSKKQKLEKALKKANQKEKSTSKK